MKHEIYYRNYCIMTEKRNKCVAYWFSQKKKKKLNVEQLRLLFKSRNIELREINFDQNLDDQGCFDAVIHKLTDMMIDAMDGNERASKNLLEFQAYLEKYPRTIQIDPLPSVRKLLDRFETYKLIRTTNICCRDKIIHVPNFTLILTKDREKILEKMQEAGVQFPFMCKKNVAHGKASHKMSIIFNESGLADVDPPCVAQTFIDHNALLYKIYVIKDTYHMVKRPSLKNFSNVRWQKHGTIFFNSHEISSCDSSRSNLTTLENSDNTTPQVDHTIVSRLTRHLHREIDMTMFGVDVIVCPKTLRHYVIDVNVFPGYDGVDDYLSRLVDIVLERIDANSDPIPNGVNGHQHTNGFQAKSSSRALVNGV